LYTRLRYGAGKAHFEEWWPLLSLTKPGTDGTEGIIRYGGRAIAPLLPYPDTLAREDELLVVGSGPSLAKQATDRIPIERAILLNGAIHLLRPSLRPFAVVVEDERFVWRHWKKLEQLVAADTDCYFSTGVTRALCETVPGWLSRQRVRHIDFVHRPYMEPRPDPAELRRLPFLRWAADGKAAISRDPRSGLVPAGSVAVTAAQIALSLEPSRIGFVGIDLTATKTPRFYEVEGDAAMSRLEAAVGRVLAAFSLVKLACEESGIALENYSPTSLLSRVGIRYFPRLSLRN
jgi:hypothetical protein